MHNPHKVMEANVCALHFGEIGLAIMRTCVMTVGEMKEQNTHKQSLNL